MEELNSLVLFLFVFDVVCGCIVRLVYCPYPGFDSVITGSFSVKRIDCSSVFWDEAKKVPVRLYRKRFPVFSVPPFTQYLTSCKSNCLSLRHTFVPHNFRVFYGWHGPSVPDASPRLSKYIRRGGGHLRELLITKAFSLDVIKARYRYRCPALEACHCT